MLEKIIMKNHATLFQTPEFDDAAYSVNILRSLGLGQRVMRVFAYDRDEGVNAEVQYSIVSRSPTCGGQSCLNLDTNTGWITVARSISDTVSTTF